MKRIFFNNLFRVSYRLSVLYKGKPWYLFYYGSSIRKLRRLARHAPNVVNWSIYKTGPLFLPEREVDSDNAKGESR